jgi:hypothetical protein
MAYRALYEEPSWIDRPKKGGEMGEECQLDRIVVKLAFII